MTTQNTQTSETGKNDKNNQPTYVAKVRHGKGDNASYEQIGVAWVNDNGSFYIKLSGTQIVSAFTLYKLDTNDES